MSSASFHCRSLMANSSSSRERNGATSGWKRGVKLITPHRRGRKRKATQDGCKLRRYTRRWKVERFFARLHFFRRVVTP
ncbi:hypothetical protein HUW62_44990 [Myxococcus sp. AM011]|nr:hypothetical protein [Myxococcus sp. AM011]